MAEEMTRRETLKRGLVAVGALALVPEWALPALAQGEIDVPFTDIPATFNPNPPTGPIGSSTFARSTDFSRRPTSSSSSSTTTSPRSKPPRIG